MLARILVFFLAVTAVGAADEPLRILPIGDSITQGRKGGQHPACYSWRYPLWKKLVDRGIEIDYLGSEKGGFNGDPDWADYKGQAFDRQNEAHWGWTAWGVRDGLENWLNGYAPPDIAVIMLGSNGEDDDKIAKNVAAHVDMIRMIRARNSVVKIVIGLPFHAWEPFPEMRVAYREMAAEQNTEASPVVVVDHSVGWISRPDQEGTHTVDWVHPNEKGDAKLADEVLAAIEPFLPR